MIEELKPCPEMVETVRRAIYDAAQAHGTNDMTYIAPEDAEHIARAAITAYDPDKRLREALDVCGANASPIPADMVGCGNPFGSLSEAYRCTHCHVLFHFDCINKHFDSSDVLTEEMVVEIERRAALSHNGE